MVPRIAISMGDPGGIGPEVISKTLKTLSLKSIPILFGNTKIIEDPILNFSELSMKEFGKATQVGDIEFVPVSDSDFAKSTTCSENGAQSFAFLNAAVSAIKNGDADALCTGPISKEAWQLSGVQYAGHTDFLEEDMSVPVSMGFVSPRLQVVLASIHIPLKNVPAYITPERLRRAILHAVELGNRQSLPKIRIAVCGLNPHAGENGVIGSEEKEWISDFVEAMKMELPETIMLSGPLPADTLFHYASRGHYDVVVALYHDQGLIPVKLLDFDKAVNVTLGLPFIRTSPDHGTAFDIAYQNKANPGSFKAAYELIEQWLTKKVN